jgi:ABC-2 type transport system permease protein
MQKMIASKYGWLLLLILLLAINFLASVVHTRIDLTKEKRYTLSRATENLLRDLYGRCTHQSHGTEKSRGKQ